MSARSFSNRGHASPGAGSRTTALATRGLLGLALLGSSACDNASKPISVTSERSQGVLATGNPEPAAAPVPVAKVAAPAPARLLCGGSLSKPGAEAPSKSLSQKVAPGESNLPSAPGFAKGSWTWVNFWAAWCGPCKEEIPRLKSWEKSLSSEGQRFRVAFVSMDDDERQLGAFLAAQSPAGLRRSYWLREGKERADWVSEVGLSVTAQLPAHVLFDPKGRLRCRIDGAIDDRDLDTLRRLLHDAQ